MVNSVTVSQEVYDRLRADVLSCQLMPGEHLRTDVLCQRYSAGYSAVREALSRLASEGFVTLAPQRGYHVTPLSSAELQDLVSTRCKIEALCIQDAIANADVEWEAGIVTALHRLSRTPARAKGDPARFDDAFAVANGLFHRAIVAACRSPALLESREALYFRQEHYLWLTMPPASGTRDLQSEHAAIAAAALALDADATAAATADHLRRSAEIILSSCVTNGDLLLPDPARVHAA